MPTPQIPSGWYANPDGSGGQRYWDGRLWTDCRAGPVSEAAEPATARRLTVSPWRPGFGSDSRKVLIRYLAACAALLALLLALVVYATLFTDDPSTTVVPADTSSSPAFRPANAEKPQSLPRR